MTSAPAPLAFEIAGVRVGLHPAADEPLPDPWIGLFPQFQIPGDPGGGYDALIGVDARAGWTNPAEPTDGLSAWRSHRTEQGYRLDGPDLHGVLARSADGDYRGELVVDDDPACGASSLLRMILSLLLAERGCLLLHASGVLRRGLLWIFSGSTGSGKTTIARELNGGGEPFCVDRAVLELDGARVIAHPTPFSDPQGSVSRRPPAPADALVFIEQAPEPRLAELAPIDTARLLLQRTMLLAGHADTAPVLTEVAARIAEQTPAFELGFARDERFWGLLDGRAGAIDTSTREGGARR